MRLNNLNNTTMESEKTRITTILTILSLMVVTAMAMKQNPDIHGKIVNEKGEALPYANVVWLSLPDSAFIQGTTSDADGTFHLISPRSEGILKISIIGYQTQFIAVSADSQPTNGWRICMEEDTNLLGEVTVTAELPQTHIEGSTMITHIQGSVLARSGTAEEMMSKIPGLMMTQEGVEVMGKGVPVIYINGRKLHNMDELKRLRSEEVASVEVDLNPGAKYDATVLSVVHIRTIKQQGEGLGFTLTTSHNQKLQQAYGDPNATLQMNYRYRGIDIFGQANFWQWHQIGIANGIVQHTYLQKGEAITDIGQDCDFRSIWSGRGMDYTWGANWQISEHHSTGIRIEYNDQIKGENQENTVTQFFYNNVPADYVINRNVTREKKPYSWQGNVYYNGKWGKLDIELNLDFLTNKSEKNGIITEAYRDGAVNEMNQINETSNRMTASKLVLSYPLWKGTLHAGSETTFIRRTSSYAISNEHIPASSSETKEQDIATFITYEFTIGWGIRSSIGMRHEYVAFNYRDFTDADNNLKRHSNDIFPNLTLTRAFGPVQTSISYQLKTIRPKYWQLNDAVNYYNSNTIQQGDPTLKNQKNHDLTLNLHYQWLNLSGNWTHYVDQITQWSRIYNDQGIILITYTNLNHPINCLSAFVNLSPTVGVWSPNLTLGWMQYDTRLELADPREASGSRTVLYNRPVYTANLNNTIRLKSRWQLEAGLRYTSKGDYVGTRICNDTWNLSAAIQKCWLKEDALTLRLSIQDILRRTQEDVIQDYGYYQITYQPYHYCNQRIDVSLRYSFNASRSKYKGSGAGQEARQRL